MLLARTIVLFPESGIYRFAIDCRDAGFLLVDEQVVAEWPGEHRSGQTVKGAPLYLAEGPHEVQFIGCSSQQVGADILWQKPSMTGFSLIPVTSFLTSYQPDYIRIENISTTIQPGFMFDVLPAYTFAGANTLFVPVRFTDISENWLRGSMTGGWRFWNEKDMQSDVADRMGSASWNVVYGKAGAKPTINVFSGEAIHMARLDLRDELGFTASVEKTVDCRNLHRKEFAFSAVPVSLPPVCYEKDMVLPELNLTGSSIKTYDFTLEWMVKKTSGASSGFVTNISLSAKSVRLPMVSARAGELSGISWKVLHADVAISQGRIKFQQFPFGDVPVRAVEDRLYDATGNQLVLVSSSSTRRLVQHAVKFERKGAKIAWIDDTLDLPDPTMAERAKLDDVLGRIMDWRGKPQVFLKRLPAWDKATGSFGPLERIVGAMSLVDSNASVIVVSLGLQDMAGAGKPDQFERYLAGLVDTLSSAFMKPVVLVTPPPFPSVAQATREYAQIVRKVAVARNMPVADLYSAFMGMNDKARLFSGRDFSLSGEGVNFAAQILAGALVSEPHVE